jgi:protein O-mannosyl-transferase
VPKAHPQPSSIAEKPRTSPRAQPEAEPISRDNLWICLCLFVATFLVYVQVRQFDFVNFDDPEIFSNSHVLHGITLDGIKWALTSGENVSWVPLTRLSHLVAYEFFGRQSGWHHLTNVLFHALAALLLFAFLNRATGARWCSAFVAFLFALHPLHVESVAWVIERKDVLSAFFGFLALWAYVRYAESPGSRRYLLVLASFGLSVLSKPMTITLPLVLLLLDVWPLRRLSLLVSADYDRKPRIAAISWREALREKVPFVAIAAGAGFVTYLVQSSRGDVKAFSQYSVGLRAANAIVSYFVYIAKMFWPTRLAVFYPFPADLPAWQVAASALAIAAVSILVLRWFRVLPYLAVGWLWYLVTLAPVIGLVQVGETARAYADRYMYIPTVGLSIMLAWGAADILRRWPHTKPAFTALATVACTLLAALTWTQLQYWKNSETLFRHALEVTDRNYLAHSSLGTYLVDFPERVPEAVGHFQTALQIKPDYEEAHNNLGVALFRLRRPSSDAVAEYEAALRLNPNAAEPHNNLATALLQVPGRLPEAIEHYEAALRINPDYPNVHENLAATLLQVPGRLPEAVPHYEAALRINPNSAEVHNGLGLALYKTGRAAEAIPHFEAALRLKPSYPEAHNNLGLILFQMPGRLPDAARHFEAALRSKPDYVDAHANLAAALLQVPGRTPDAIAHYEAALRIKPDSAEVHYNLGAILSNVPSRLPEAIDHFEAALQILPDADTHYALGVSLSKVPGRMPEAIGHLEATLRINPAFASARQMLAQLRTRP